jgi:TPR repeat protein
MPKKRAAGPTTKFSESDAWHRKSHQLWEQGHHRLAFRRFLAAAKRGDASAQLNLGYFYDYGIGVPRRQSVALYWYKRAYGQGKSGAANNAGTIYRDRGEFQTALMWFERALALGDTSANWQIARMYFRQRKDIPRTVLHLKRVVQAKPGVDVTRWEFEAANRLLWRLERRNAAA